MRAILGASLLLAVSLAGCSGGSGFAAMLLIPGDLPGCQYAVIEGGLKELGDDVGWSQNPGTFDAEATFGDDYEGANVTGGMLAIFDCGEDGEEAFSWALAFETPAQARMAAEQEGCDDDWGWPTVLRGNLIAQFDIEYEPEGTETDEGETAFLHGLLRSLEQRSGGEVVCPEAFDYVA